MLYFHYAPYFRAIIDITLDARLLRHAADAMPLLRHYDDAEADTLPPIFSPCFR